VRTVAVLIILCSSVAAQTSANQVTQFSGCISQVPGEGLQFQAEPAGKLYVLGNSSLAAQHVNQRVRLRGAVYSGSSQGFNPPVINVESIEVKDKSCTSGTPAHKPVAVVGKVGEGQMAIPVTTSGSAGETTPGFQTETGAVQEPPRNGRALISPKSAPYSPMNVAQAAQSNASAETYAISDARSEIVPGNTLGAETKFTSAGVSNLQQQRTPVTIELRGDRQFTPAAVTVGVGEPLTWKNLSSDVHEVVSNSAKAASSTTATGARPFDSGLLRPGATFTYSFDSPGVYHYVCWLNCNGNSGGTVTVRQR